MTAHHTDIFEVVLNYLMKILITVPVAPMSSVRARCPSIYSRSQLNFATHTELYSAATIMLGGSKLVVCVYMSCNQTLPVVIKLKQYYLLKLAVEVSTKQNIQD